MRNKKGFTLVEILIVVVILGILAAIVIPQFTNASSEAKASRVAADLQTLRSQVELFKIQHTDLRPGEDTAATFAQCMTGCTSEAGAVVATGTAGAKGPYMQSIPTNPYATASGDVVALDGSGDHGWNYITGTGQIVADPNS
jgi:general secretion pathway protein G